MTCADPPEVSEVWDRGRIESAFGVSRETSDRLAAYVAQLREWQKRINLIGPATEDDIWGRHIADSLQLVRLAPAGATTWLDLGSGAGLPGLVLAIALADRPGLAVHLVESNARKAAFLRVAALETGAPVTVHTDRIEILGAREDRPRPDVITARALAPLDRLLAYAEPFMWKTTVCLFPKGRDVAQELTQAATCWRIVWDSTPSVVDPAAAILRIEEAKRHD